MTWFKVDDNLAFHRKVVAAGNAAMGLWVRAGSWCADNLTDGHVPDGMLRQLGTRPQAEALVKAGLWVKTADGYRFHSWREYQPTSKEAKTAKRKMSGSGKLGNHRRWHEARGVTDPDCPYCDTRNHRVPDREPESGPESHMTRPVPDPITQAPMGLRPYGAWTGKPNLLLVPGTGISSTAMGNPAPRARANGQANRHSEPDVTSGNGEDTA